MKVRDFLKDIKYWNIYCRIFSMLDTTMGRKASDCDEAMELKSQHDPPETSTLTDECQDHATDKPLQSLQCDELTQLEAFTSTNNTVNPDIVNNTKKSKIILRNYLLMCFSYFLMYFGNGSMQYLLTNFHKKGGIGFATYTAIYTSKAFTLIPSATIVQKISAKWSMALAYTCNLSLVLGSFYPNMYVMVTCGILTGFGIALFYVAQGVMYTNSANIYASLTNEDRSNVLPRFSGFFFGFMNAGSFIGNLVSSLIFHLMRNGSGNPTNQTTYLYNDTVMNNHQLVKFDYTVNATSNGNTSGLLYAHCGAAFCSYKQDTMSTEPKHTWKGVDLVYVVYAVYGMSELLAILIAVVMLRNVAESPDGTKIITEDKLVKRQEVSDKTTISPLDIIRVLKDRRVVILIPFFFFVHQSMVMFVGHVTQAFVACVHGIGWVGYVNALFALSVTVSSLGSGYISKCIHRNIQLLIALIVLTGTSFVWLLWQPTLDQLIPTFLLALPSAMIYAITQVQNYSLIAEVFSKKKTEVFTLFLIMESLGGGMLLSIGHTLCFSAKVFIHLVVVFLASISYSYFFITHRRLKPHIKYHQEQIDVKNVKH